MNFPSFPDIAGMIILMGVLDWLRRKHRDSSVDLWMLGLTFIVLESMAVIVMRSHPALNDAGHTVALDCYVLAALTFGWAARQDLIPGELHLPLFLLPAIPMFAAATLYGLGLHSVPTYLWIAIASLVIGVGYILNFIRDGGWFRIRVLGIHLVIWAPMIWMASHANFRLYIYWGLACMYLLVAVSFRKRIKRGGIGGLVIVAGFVVWAMCFLAHPFLRSVPVFDDMNEQVWTMQKFFVVIGMLLVLLEEQSLRLEREAMHDALTGLPNRRLFDDRLVQAMSRARRTGRSSAVFVIDLDNFKQINDTLGHRTGDLVLTRTAQMLKSRIRSSDTLARCGGDEFNVIVNDLARAADCERIADTLREAVRFVEIPPGEKTSLSCSIGYALYPDDVSDVTELCELADVRMYKDKRIGHAAGSERALPAARSA